MSDACVCPQLWLLNSDTLVLWAPEETVMAHVLDSSPSLRPPSPSQSRAAAGALKLLYVDCSAAEGDRSQEEYDALIRPSVLSSSISLLPVSLLQPVVCACAPGARSRCV